VFGSAFITVLHEPDTDLAEIVEALGGARHVETHNMTSFGEPKSVSIFKASASTAHEQAQQALWFVTNVFPSKGAARGYIREKEQYT
jgi:hypothetical protein